MTNSRFNFGSDEDSSIVDHLHGNVLALAEHLEELEFCLEAIREEQLKTSETLNQFMAQTRLLMGALIQHQSPETIINLLTVHQDHESQEPPQDSQ